MLNYLLIFLKCVGLIISFLAAYISALPEPKKKNPPKKPAQHWLGRKAEVFLGKDWRKRWIVIGLGVALSSQFAETMKSTHDATEAREKDRRQIQRTEDQVALARFTLEKIERVVTRFEDLEVTAAFEFPPDAFYSKGLLLENLFPSFDLAGSTNQVDFAGYINNPDYRTTLIRHEGANILFNVPIEALENLNKQDPNRISEHNGVLDFIRLPKTTLRIWRHSPDDGESDFVASSSGCRNIIWEIVYPSRNLRVTWTSRYPKSNWTNNAVMSCLPDLSNAYVNICLENYHTNGVGRVLKSDVTTKTPHAVTLKVCFNSMPIDIHSLAVGYEDLVVWYGRFPVETHFLSYLPPQRSNPPVNGK